MDNPCRQPSADRRRPLRRLCALAAPAVLAAMLVAAPTSGHHSAAMFDHEQVLELEGTVVEFQWTNPHTWIQFEVRDDDGETVEWSAEWRGLNSLARQGYGPRSFEPGDRLRIRLNPMRNGAPAGGFIGALFEDGRTAGTWDAD